MKKVTIKPNQTIYDIALSEYGTCEAVAKIINDNPDLANDDSSKVLCGIDPINDKGLYLDLPLLPGSTVLIDMDSVLKKILVKELVKPITTFDILNYGTDNK